MHNLIISFTVLQNLIQEGCEIMSRFKKLAIGFICLGMLFVNSIGIVAYAKEETDVISDNIFDVTVFGATVDDESDDGSAIQGAFDACNEVDGGTVYFPKGIYNVSKTIFFYSNQNILFEDGAVMKRVANSENVKDTCGVFLCNWFDVENTNSETSSVACRNVVISGGMFDGGGATPTESPCPVAMINTCHADNVVIENCKFINNYNAHCIEINSSDNVTISNCEFDDYYGTTSQVRYNEIIQIDKSVNAALGTYFDGASYRTLRGYNSVTYIDYVSPDCKGCSNIIIKDCDFISNAYCSAIGNHHESPYSTTNSIIQIFNNTFSGGTSSRGYIVFDCHTTDIEIFDNKFYGGECGVTVNADSAECNVYNNEFYSCKVISKGDVTAYDNYIEEVKEEKKTGFALILETIKEFFNNILNFIMTLFGM